MAGEAWHHANLKGKDSQLPVSVTRRGSPSLQVFALLREVANHPYPENGGFKIQGFSRRDIKRNCVCK
jgi:hypothetical protein